MGADTSRPPTGSGVTILKLDWRWCLSLPGREAEPYPVPIFTNGSPQTSSNSCRFSHSVLLNKTDSLQPISHL